MPTFTVENVRSGITIGVVDANTVEEALDIVARDAGYDGWDDCCEQVGRPADGEIVVTPK